MSSLFGIDWRDMDMQRINAMREVIRVLDERERGSGKARSGPGYSDGTTRFR